LSGEEDEEELYCSDEHRYLHNEAPKDISKVDNLLKMS
jgi:hypothetical protein